MPAVEYDESPGRDEYATTGTTTKTVRKRQFFPSQIENDEEASGDLLPQQTAVRDWYQTDPIQIGVAVLIFANFIVSMSNVEVRPVAGSGADWVYYGFEIFFNAAFTIELIVNMYGSFPLLFWKSGWNWFDFIIVGISLLTMLLRDLPGIGVLRLFRAFRVFRLFKRIPSLKSIIEGVGASLPGVANAFVVVQIISGIWSIIGVEFFKQYDEIAFGSFSKAMFSMYQIMTLDAWASAIARPIVAAGADFVVVSVFFVSYGIINGILLTNVVIAILLDKYLQAVAATEGEGQEGAEEEDSEDVDRDLGCAVTRESTIKSIMGLIDSDNGNTLKSCNSEELRKLHEAARCKLHDGTHHMHTTKSSTSRTPAPTSRKGSSSSE